MYEIRNERTGEVLAELEDVGRARTGVIYNALTINEATILVAPDGGIITRAEAPKPKPNPS